MSTAHVLEAIEKKHADVNALILNAAKERKLEIEIEVLLRRMNDELAKRLTVSFITGQALMKLHALDGPQELLVLQERGMNLEQAFSKMRYLIEEDALGSKHPEIKKAAADAWRPVEPAAVGLAVYRMYEPQFCSEKPEDSEEKYEILRREMGNYAIAAQAMHHLVRSQIGYISEGDENFQRALHTLMVRGGDCDDIAILLGSLLRSHGYHIYLQYPAGHVFTGVVLGTPMPSIAVQSLPARMKRQVPSKYSHGSYFPMKYVNIPLDLVSFRSTDAGAFFDVFDIYSGRLTEIIRANFDSKAQLEASLSNANSGLVETRKELHTLVSDGPRSFIPDHPIHALAKELCPISEITDLLEEQIGMAFKSVGEIAGSQ